MSRLHFMGIGGQGISAVAQMARAAGNAVSGCDRQASATTRALQQAGITVEIGHSARHSEDVDALVISPAVPALDPRNPELLAARERGLRVLTWQELLGELMRGKCVLSVCGVHGKGTTTSMLSLMLVDAGLDPTCEIGAVVPRFGANYRLGQSDFFVNEADEFNHNFWHYHPRVVVVTNIEFEHPEFFANYDAFLAAFEYFIRGMDITGDWPIPPTLILNADSPGCHDLRQRLADWPGQLLTFSVEGMRPAALQIAGTTANFEAYDLKLEGETSFRVRERVAESMDTSLIDQVIHLQVPGRHNVQNALAALAAARVVGIPAGTLIDTLASFTGTKRRFEIRHRGPLYLNNSVVDVILIDDYAHHPTAIMSMLEAVRQAYTDRRIIAVYQPHMYSRTKTFFGQFVQAFDAADIAIISDIFPARERDTGLVHARELIEAMQQRPHFAGQAIYGGSKAETRELLKTILRSGDLVLIMGAGDIYTITEELLETTKEPG